METEERGQLPFLDVLLSKQSVSDRQGSFITSVYRKKTYTGLLTNYFSFTPFKYKLGLIKTLIDRLTIKHCDKTKVKTITVKNSKKLSKNFKKRRRR